ncbi:serine hydrolase domain-containing protein [Parafilimonas sp.]|uniref:serine hydrolase domain-containing protein n=1 Tax=Parafilimonas sp. TaxID=1969739 RepID=UPI003F7E8F97
MMKFTAILLFLFSLLHANAFGQHQFLVLHQAVSSEINPQKPDSFYIKMQKSQFASLRVTEKNVRVFVEVFDPSDSLFMIVDENQMGNKEVVSFFSKASGNYKVKVMWGFIKPLSGKYSIILDKLEMSGQTPVQKAAQLFDGWYENEAPGAAVLVMKNGKVVFKGTKGLANLEDRVPLQSNSVFEIASCSKQFTGLAVAMLIDKGMIGLEDDIRKYIPEMPDYGHTITIANLVYHTSGIRSTDDLEFAGFTPEDIITLPMCINFAVAQQHLKFTPGEQYHYSNTNYNLLAEIVTRVTKQSFASWTKENIFEPLGMKATFFKTEPGQVYVNKVLCYKGIQSGFQQKQNNWAATGASALCTTLDDLAKWVNSFETKKLINPNIEKLLESKGSLNNGSKTAYSFGNEWKETGGKKQIIHLGLVIGYRTAIVRFPEEKLAVVYLSNDDNDATFQRYLKMSDLFLNGNLREQKPTTNNIPVAETVVKKMEEGDKYRETIDLSPYTGTYFSEELSCVWVLKTEDGRLVIKHPRMQTIKLKYSGNDSFGFLKFDRDTENKIVGLKILGEGIAFVKSAK